MGKTSRDSQAEVDTVIAVSSDEIKKARAAVESVTSETSTIDCHPIVLEEGADIGSDSGLVKKKQLTPIAPRIALPPSRAERVGPPTPRRVAAPPADLNQPISEETETLSVSIKSAPLATPDDDGEDIAVETADETDRAASPPVTGPKATDYEDETMTRQHDLVALEARPKPPPPADDTATEPREPVKIDKAKMLQAPRDDETRPMPVPGDISGALETVPLNANLVHQVLMQVDARAAARAAGQAVPAFALAHPPANPTPVDPEAALKATTPSQQRTEAMPNAPVLPVAPPRRIGLEVAIALFAFLVVAVPALYFLWVHFQ